MGKKKLTTKAVEASEQPAPPVRHRAGQNLNVWLPDDLMDAFDQLLHKNRRTKTAETQLMMEAWLTQHGVWPRSKGRKPPAGPEPKE